MLKIDAQAFGFERAPEGVLVHAVGLFGPCGKFNALGDVLGKEEREIDGWMDEGMKGGMDEGRDGWTAYIAGTYPHKS